MKISAVQYAITKFNELRGEFEDAIQQLGLQTLVCMVRQHYLDVDRGWAFFEIGLETLVDPAVGPQSPLPTEYVLWGKMVEERAGKDKQVIVIVDPETIDSIEFEIYDPRPGDEEA